jgi:hypothetical protein
VTATATSLPLCRLVTPERFVYAIGDRHEHLPVVALRVRSRSWSPVWVGGRRTCDYVNVGLTAMPLTCPRAFICRGRSGRSPRARGASAPGQPTARGQVQPLVGRLCSNMPTGAVRFRSRRRRTHAPAWPVRPPAALRAASFPRERQRAVRPRGPQALLLRLATGSFSPVRTAADAQLTTAHQRIFENALACGGYAAARHYNSSGDSY